MATNNSVNGWKQSVGSGNPNGSVAGSIGDQYFDNIAFILYQCSIAGSTSTAVWVIQGVSNQLIFVNAATTGGTITGTYNNGSAGVGATFTVTATGVQTFDGQTVVLNGVYLIKNQSSAFQNGVYVCTTAGAVGVSAVFTRATNYNTPDLINSNIGIKTLAGSTQTPNQTFSNSQAIVTIGTSNISYGLITLMPTTNISNQVIIGSGFPGSVTSIAATANGILVTNGGGTPSIATTAPSGLTIPKPLISGQTTATTVAAGNIGELISSIIPFASSVNAVATNTPFNITSISLTAGDWDVWGNAYFNTLNGTQLVSWISLTSATQPDNSLLSFSFNAIVSGAPVPPLRVNVSTTTTVFLSANIIFVSGTAQACGGIYARRRD